MLEQNYLQIGSGIFRARYIFILTMIGRWRQKNLDFGKWQKMHVLILTGGIVEKLW